MSDTFSRRQRLATFVLLPGIVARNVATVTSLAFFADPGDFPGDDIETVLRADPWVARLRSVVDWDALEADWMLGATARSMVPFWVVLAVFPWHDKLQYPLTNPSAVPAELWLPLAYVLANVLFAAGADMADTYADAYFEAKHRLRPAGGEG